MHNFNISAHNIWTLNNARRKIGKATALIEVYGVIAYDLGFSVSYLQVSYIRGDES